jgi:hypothetical protein
VIKNIDYDCRSILRNRKGSSSPKSPLPKSPRSKYGGESPLLNETRQFNNYNTKMYIEGRRNSNDYSDKFDVSIDSIVMNQSICKRNATSKIIPSKIPSLNDFRQDISGFLIEIASEDGLLEEIGSPKQNICNILYRSHRKSMGKPKKYNSSIIPLLQLKKGASELVHQKSDISKIFSEQKDSKSVMSSSQSPVNIKKTMSKIYKMGLPKRKY